jgi:hypothetical protein
MTSWRTHVATWLFTCVLPADEAESLVGDLEEEGTSRGSSNIAVWYWAQVARSLIPLCGVGLRRGGWLSTVTLALLTCSCQAAIELTAAGMVWGLRPGTVHPVPLTLVITLPSFVWLSYRATRIRPGAGPAVAAVAAVALSARLWLAPGAGARVPVDVLVALVVAPAMALTGTFLALRGSRSLTRSV